MKKRTIAVCTPDQGTSKIFKKRGYSIELLSDYKDLDKRKSYEFIVFTGGSDVDPSMYGEKSHHTTLANPSRDRFEKTVFDLYPTTLKVGICRGAQILCVLSGGKLFQNIPGHTNSDHFVNDLYSGKAIRTAGDHHQSCIVLPHWQILATSSAEWGETGVPGKKYNIIVPEAFYVAETNSFCVQFHPEWDERSSEGYFFSMLEKFL